MTYDIQYKQYFDTFESYSSAVLDELKGNQTLIESMKYGVKNGGKRVRAVLALSFAELLNVKKEDILPFALAIECIHAYSLIHDDLPALDNDDFRRGKPSNHKVFGEDIAIIAGDALLNYAYETLLKNATTKEKLAAAAYISECAGYKGMVGGQAYDLQSEGKSGEEYLYNIDLGKTCKLLQAPVVSAAILAGKDYLDFENFGRDLGLLFQFTDDVLDEIGDSSKLGKTVGKDKEENKLTAVSVYGLDGAKAKIEELKNSCLGFLQNFDNAEFLITLVKKLAEREY